MTTRSPQEPSSAQLSRGRILVVDDNPMNVELLEQEFEDAGYEMAGAYTGMECLELLQREHFSLVVLDVMMPGMSGLEVLTELRKRWSRTDLPVLMATARSGSKDVVEALRLGANDYVTKPIDMAVLLARLEVLIDVQSARPRARSGVFQELVSGERTLNRHDADQWCMGCLGCLDANAPQCPQCEACPPAEGWPAIPRQEHPFLGRKIGGRYFLDKVIGRGGGGSVYRALELDIERHFGVKIIHLRPDGVRQSPTHRQALKEIKTLAQLRNPHVVQVFEIVMADDHHCAVLMEFLEGVDLKQAISNEGPLAIPVALDVVRQVAIGLHALHELGFVHCDIKPANIMLQPMPGDRYFAKLVDFGIVQPEGHIDQGMFSGTPRYSAPEQLFKDKPIDRRTDIYGLGLVLFNLVTGQSPVEGDDLAEIAWQKGSNTARIVSCLGVSPEAELVDQLIQSMTQQEPADRLGSVAEVIREIEELLKNPLVAHSKPTKKNWRENPRDDQTVHTESGFDDGETN